MQNLASKYRGEFINEVSWLEKMIDSYISTYFVGYDELKTRDMHYLLLGADRITLDNKRQVFHYIAEKHDRDWYKSYKSIRANDFDFKKAIPMNIDLTYIITTRNVLAHRILDTSNQGRENFEKISFLNFKNDLSRVDISDSDFGTFKFIIDDLTKHIYARIKK